MVIYGQVIVGPPGSGKTTYCNGMQQHCILLAVTINLGSTNKCHLPRSNDNDNNDTHEPHLLYDALPDT